MIVARTRLGRKRLSRILELARTAEKTDCQTPRFATRTDTMNLHLVIDIDGVIADHALAILRRLRERHGLHVSKEQLTTWNPTIGEIAVGAELEDALQDPEFVLSMELIKDARTALIELVKDHSITIATSRPPTMDEHTRKWLDQKGIPFHRYANTSRHGKGSVIGDVLVDDYPKSVIDFSTSGRPAILFDQPWNEDDRAAESAGGSQPVVRARGWDEVIEMVRSIETGKEQHSNSLEATSVSPRG